MSGIVEFSVGGQEQGQRLDNFILRHFRAAPKSLIYKQIRTGQVRVNGKRKKAEYRLGEGDSVRLPNLANIIGKETRKPIVPSRESCAELEATILYEDEHLLCINKQSGLSVHSGSGVASGVIERFRAIRPQAPFLELAHRLDRGTSGCLLLAKSRSALVAVHEQLRQRGEMTKWYTAMCFHRVPFDATRVYDCREAVMTSKGMQGAHSRFEVIEQNDYGALLAVEIRTGRKHQIRQHCAQLGVPIVGDTRHGDFGLNRQLPLMLKKRLMLHANRLQLMHPVSNKPLQITAPLPQGFDLLLLEGIA